MSTSQDSDPSMSQNSAEALMQFFGIDRMQADAFLERFNERFIEPYAEFAEVLFKALSPMTEGFAAFAKSMDEQIAAAPEIPGHEKLLIELD